MFNFLEFLSAALEYSQMVRHTFLIRKIMGSNPIIPTFIFRLLCCNGGMVYTLGLGSNSYRIKGSSPFYSIFKFKKK